MEVSEEIPFSVITDASGRSDAMREVYEMGEDGGEVGIRDFRSTLEGKEGRGRFVIWWGRDMMAERGKQR
jgi:hypothetical protein